MRFFGSDVCVSRHVMSWRWCGVVVAILVLLPAAADRPLEAAPTAMQPQTATIDSSGLISIYPGESIQAAVDAHPVGTGFLIKAGVHPQRMERYQLLQRN